MKPSIQSALSAAVLALVAALPASAQPDTDIHIGELLLGPSSVEIRGVYNATARPGYDNQPWFTPDGAALLYALIESETPDIYRYSVADRSSVRLAETPGGDLSPSALDENGEFLALSNGGIEDSPWGVWRFAASGEPIAPLIDPVFRDRVAPSPPQRIPGDSGVSIAEPDYVGRMWIKRLALDSREVTPIVPTVGQAWHYARTPDGRLPMAEGGAIFVVSANGTRIAFVAQGS